MLYGKTEMIIRKETAVDIDAIRDITIAAFKTLAISWQKADEENVS